MKLLYFNFNDPQYNSIAIYINDFYLRIHEANNIKLQLSVSEVDNLFKNFRKNNLVEVDNILRFVDLTKIGMKKVWPCIKTTQSLSKTKYLTEDDIAENLDLGTLILYDKNLMKMQISSIESDGVLTDRIDHQVKYINRTNLTKKIFHRIANDNYQYCPNCQYLSDQSVWDKLGLYLTYKKAL